MVQAKGDRRPLGEETKVEERDMFLLLDKGCHRWGRVESLEEIYLWRAVCVVAQRGAIAMCVFLFEH